MTMLWRLLEEMVRIEGWMDDEHTNGAVGSLLVVRAVESGTSERCDSEECSHADEFSRHRVGKSLCGEMSRL